MTTFALSKGTDAFMAFSVPYWFLLNVSSAGSYPRSQKDSKDTTQRFAFNPSKEKLKILSPVL